MPNLFFILLVACALVGLGQQYVSYGLALQRRIYWTCACLGAVAAFFAFHPDSKKGIWMGLFFLGVMLVAAYGYTPYIKIGGKIYALTVQDSQPDSDDDDVRSGETAAPDRDHDRAPDAYSGLLTPAKMWWLLVPILIISTGNIIAFASGKGEWWVAAIGLAFIVFLSVAMGFGDASWGYGIARGHRVPFVIAAIVTVGVFAALYLVAYQAGKRRPVRRKESMEYRAHPRHRNLD
jgi:hypothetical protein